jgi:hypothetical protein
MSEQYPNFRRLVTGVDVAPALEELNAHPELWTLITVRQAYAESAHADTETIVLRGPDTLEGLFENLECINFPVFDQLMETRTLVRDVAEFIHAREVGRVMLVRLKEGGWIRPHIDEGAYARYFARFHLPLQTNEACRFKCGEEITHMAPGELWWFNHQQKHSVVNRGGSRIHLIMDFAAPGFTGALEHIRAPD